MGRRDGERAILARATVAALGVIAVIAVAVALGSASRHDPGAWMLVGGAILLLAAAALAVAEPALAGVAVRGAGVAVASVLPLVVATPALPVAVRAAAVAAAPFVAPLLVAVVAGAGIDRDRVRRRRPLVWCAFAVTAVGTLAVVTTRDPFIELICPTDCTVRVLAVWADPRAAMIAHTVWTVACGAMAVTAAAWTVHGLRSGGEERRSALALGAPAVAALVVVTVSVILTTDPGRRPLAVPLSLALVALAVGLGWRAAALRRRRGAVRALTVRSETSPEPGALRDELARQLGDPSLRLDYRLPGTTQLVDARGRPVPPLGGSSERTTIALERGDDLVAVLDIDAKIFGRTNPLGRIGAAARAAIDNERFTVALRTRHDELTASRRRTIDIADDTSRSIERDLHDGAQAELVALLYELTRARAAADRDGAGELAATLARDGETVSSIAARLRDLSHGVYPAILDTSGLDSALRALADVSHIPATVRTTGDGPAAPSADRVAYRVALEALQAPARDDGTHVDIEVERGPMLSVAVRGIRTPPPLRVQDRVGALGGTLTWNDEGWKAVLPCGS